LPPKSPLVVVLHDCRQAPESFDAVNGFTRMAKARGFIVLFPEQTTTDNSQRCFNWFRPSAVAHECGELLSIRQMIKWPSFKVNGTPFIPSAKRLSVAPKSSPFASMSRHLLVP